jgi:hypothetical protein
MSESLLALEIIVVLRLAQFVDSKGKMQAAFVKELLVGFNEDSVRARKARMRSTADVKTSCRIQVVTSAPLEKIVPDKKFDDFHGSTRNDLITLVTLPRYDNCWQLIAKTKHLCYSHPEGSRRLADDREAKA